MAVSEKDEAPDFTLKDQDGKDVRLSHFRGKTVILYFYPKDDTPACTKEACSIRDTFSSFGEHNAVVLGVSADDAGSHQKFRTQFNLPFTLLTDPDFALAKMYGAWGTKNLYGRIYEGLLRWTFIISPDGSVKKIIKKVKTASHGVDLLAYI